MTICGNMGYMGLKGHVASLLMDSVKFVWSCMFGGKLFQFEE
jgi:hypothetical protein